MVTNDHHVAWKDRIGLSERWEEAIKGCYYSWGENSFMNHLDALEHMIVNIKDGPQLHDMVQDYKTNVIQPDLYNQKMKWINDNIELAENRSYIRDLEIQLTRKGGKRLFTFIIQLLEDNGFGFYKSDDGEVESF